MGVRAVIGFSDGDVRKTNRISRRQFDRTDIVYRNVNCSATRDSENRTGQSLGDLTGTRRRFRAVSTDDLTTKETEFRLKFLVIADGTVVIVFLFKSLRATRLIARHCARANGYRVSRVPRTLRTLAADNRPARTAYRREDTRVVVVVSSGNVAATTLCTKRRTYPLLALRAIRHDKGNVLIERHFARCARPDTIQTLGPDERTSSSSSVGLANGRHNGRDKSFQPISRT